MSYEDIIPTPKECMTLHKLHKLMIELKVNCKIDNEFYNDFENIYNRFFKMDKYLCDFGNSIERDIQRLKNS